MLRAILIALSGLACFLISVLTMIPLRMNPVANYNLFYMPIMAIIFSFLFYRLCTEAKESKAYLYAFFAALVGWPLLGETAALPVPEGIIRQFSSVDIMQLGGYYYVVAGWIMLNILWRTKAIKNSVAVFLMTFLGIWTFELYMENYSSRVPLDMMPLIANIITVVTLILSIALLYTARKATTLEKKTVIGCLLYLTVAIILMGSGPWKKPQSFYLKYEGPNMKQELKELQEEIEYFEKVKNEMIERGLYEEEKDNQ
ncbi:MAG: hypothetical protein JRE20_04065 [Deltaproteobacteria bacterium]|nr:hypothetical protein [Deltaproteobacteria bacterium]